MPLTKVVAIFWGTSWATNTFTADKITGLREFYSKLSSNVFTKNYTNTCNEYTGYSYYTHTIKKVTSYITLASTYMDTSSSLGASTGSSVQPVFAEVCKVISLLSISTNDLANYYFPVYVDVTRLVYKI